MPDTAPHRGLVDDSHRLAPVWWKRQTAEAITLEVFEKIKMKVCRLDHVQLAMPVGREDDARKFYNGVLGISEVVKPAHLAARGGCWFEQGALKIHLGVETDFTPARKAHPAFIVDDLRTLAADLRRGGHRVVEDQPLEGYNRLYVSDPFGNRIELMEMKP